MAPTRTKKHFSHVEIEQILAQVSVADQAPSTSSKDAASVSSSSGGTQDSFDSLGPIIRQLHDQGNEDVFLRSLSKFVEDKEGEIEKICGENYQDFVSSVSTLLTVRQGTVHLRHRIGELDGQMNDVGRALMDKKKSLLQQRKVADNLDGAIETLQSCMRMLDLVSRISQMIKDGKYWGALRSLEDLSHLPPSPLSQTPFFQHILASLPSLRAQVKDAVTAAEKSWLFDVRMASGDVGRLATEEMARRVKRWKVRKERDETGAMNGKVGGAVESMINEKNEFDVLDNDVVKIDFTPLYQCIHIYDALDSRAALQRTYQEDRKTQANLILSQRSSPTPSTILSILPPLMEELIGFFILERHVLRSTQDFRSARDVDDLWDDMCTHIVQVVDLGLARCEELEVFEGVKANVLMFIQTLETYGYSILQLNALLLTLFSRYSDLLERKFVESFDDIIFKDDHQPMLCESPEEFDRIVLCAWMRSDMISTLHQNGFPQPLPFSQAYVLVCIDLRQLVDHFYIFVEGVTDHTKDIDAVLRKALDAILADHVSGNIARMLKTMNNLSQIAQIVQNLEMFQVACSELEHILTTLRAAHRGGQVRLTSVQSFSSTLSLAQVRIAQVIASKVDDFFELASLDWTPASPRRGGGPADYVADLMTFLPSFVDAVLCNMSDNVRDLTYLRATEHIAATFMDWLTGSEVQALNDTALVNLQTDVRFIEAELARLGKRAVDDVFLELNSMLGLVLSPGGTAMYLSSPAQRKAYPAVRPKRLAGLLAKLARYGLATGQGKEYEKGVARRGESDLARRLPSAAAV